MKSIRKDTILVIDNYDSFTYNLVDYIGSSSKTEVIVLRNNEVSIAEIEDLAPTAIVISPGPKSPGEAGISKEVIKIFGDRGVPILGVCLGHQAIAEVYGGVVCPAKELLHGKTSLISITIGKLFTGLPRRLIVTRYHSLAVQLDTTEQLEVVATSEDGEIMAIQHVSKPIYGIQFHPESICTEFGKDIIANFLREACCFSEEEYKKNYLSHIDVECIVNSG